MRPPPRPAALVAACVAAGVVALTGCQGEPRELAPTDAPSAMGSTTGSSTATPTPTQPTASGGVALTPGGTRLALGEPATVVLNRGEREGAAQVTVASVTRGATADLADFNVGAQQIGVPWYVTLRVTDRGEGALGGASLPVTARDGSDTLLAPTLLVGRLPRCPQQTLPATLATGATADVCALFLLPAAASLTRVDLGPPGSEDPITWSTPTPTPAPTPSASPSPRP